MPDNIYIGNFGKGLTLNPLPFNIDNDAFPTLYNFYSWRKRVKRKRGTILLGQLQRQEQIATGATPNNWQLARFALVAGAGNFISQYSLGSGATIVPGSISITVGANTYTDASADGILTGSPSGTGTINYATGAFTISGGGTSNVTGSVATVSFAYYPGLPVLGLRDYISPTSVAQYPVLLAFDQTYAYQFNSTTSMFYSVSYYKGSENPVTWTGQDYQQFWTTNYSGALWATNNNPGMQFEPILTITVGNPTIITTTAPHGLVSGDYVFFNEITGADANLLNGQAFVITKTGATTFTVAVDTTGKAINNTGIFQTLTAKSPTSTGDGIRWYDGDMTNGTGIPVSNATGWVNFAPPLTATSVSIDNETSALYYLVGAVAILAFKDRLLFFGPWIQTSSGVPIQLKDTVIWSWNGTPYYNALVPAGETFDITAYYVDQTGKGGYLAAGTAQAITTVTNNEDVLLIGFTGKQTRFVYTGNDISPFLFFVINSEYGSSSTFSGITADRGGYALGVYGITLTTQQSSQRIDLDIPDSVFQLQALNNGVQRVNAVRDFYKEWMYFTYPVNNSAWKFPTQTFLYNYREGTWALLYENFTAQGNYRKSSHYTWATLPFPTWATWREPWNSGSTSALFPSIVGGNPQGYVLIKGEGTAEGISGTIQAIANNGNGFTRITSVNHCVSSANPNTGIGDYLYFQGALGTLTATITGITQAVQAVVTATNTFTAGEVVYISEVAGMTQINGRYASIVSATASSFTLDLNTTDFSAYTSAGLATASPLSFQIGQVIATPDANTFDVDITYINLGYIGLGHFSRLSQPLLQTKQFPFYWSQGRQVRLAAQKYLMDYTSNGQVTVNIYLSQDPDDVYNNPMTNVPPNSLIYSQLMYTCPEATNLGLTPSNVNLQMPTAQGQYQIWHRFNTSLIGDTFQIGITLSNAQMRNLTFATSEIALHAIHFVVQPGPHLA